MSTELPPLVSAAELREAAEALRVRARALGALAKAVEAGAPRSIAAAHEKLAAAPLPADPGPQLGAWVEAERSSRRRRLATELRAGCDAAGIEARVEARAPLRLRVVPFSLEVDVDADRAVLGFGRAELRTVRADAGAVLEAHGALQEELGARPVEQVHEELRQAWRLASGSPEAPWVTLAAVRSALCWVRQSAAFHRRPTAGRFTELPRAVFLFELHRLRAAGALAQSGWRLGLGTAAAGSMKDRDAVFWVEDGQGRGQWHHTLRFTREA
jgi:hypothetical protein